jgi:hypothetical protein
MRELSTVRHGHSLGRRIIEMDLQIHLPDPLLFGHAVLEELVDQIGHSALLLTVLHDASVLCVEECRAPLRAAN